MAPGEGHRWRREKELALVLCLFRGKAAGPPDELGAESREEKREDNSVSQVFLAKQLRE